MSEVHMYRTALLRPLIEFSRIIERRHCVTLPSLRGTVAIRSEANLIGGENVGGGSANSAAADAPDAASGGDDDDGGGDSDPDRRPKRAKRNRTASPHQIADQPKRCAISASLPPEGYVRLPQIIGDPKATPPIPPIIPVSKSSWWAGCKSGRYPKPVKLGPRTTAWRVEDIRSLFVSA